MILFFQVPAVSSLVSGGYRYNSEIGRRLLSTGLGKLVELSEQDLTAGQPNCSLEHPQAILVFDSLYVALIDPPDWLAEQESRTRLMLHYLPSLNPLLTTAARSQLEAREEAWMRSVAGVLTTSALLAEVVMQRFDLAAQVAMPGVHGCFRDRQRRVQDCDQATVVSVGPIVPEKGQLDIAKAMATSALANTSRTHRLILVGDPDADREYCQAVRQASAGFELVLTGSLPSERVAEQLDQADLFVSASVFESYGMAIAEAAASGLPVLSYRVGEVARWVEDGLNGYLFEHGQVDLLTRRIVQLFGDASGIRRLHEHERQLFFPSFEYTFKRFLRGCKSVETNSVNRPTSAPRLYSSCDLPTRFGLFKVKVYRLDDGEEAVVISIGDLCSTGAPFVRVHSECFTGEILHSLKCDCRLQLEQAIQAIAERKRGAIIYQRQEGRGIGLGNKIRAYAEQQNGADTVEANERLGFPADMREFGVAAEILKLEGVHSVQLNTNNPDKVTSLEAHGVRVERVIASQTSTNPHNVDYLKTKFKSMGHAGLEYAFDSKAEQSSGSSNEAPGASLSTQTGSMPSLSKPQVLIDLKPSQSLLIVDLDGVIKLEAGIPAEARELLKRLGGAGYTIRFFTNDGINSRATRCLESELGGFEMQPEHLYTASSLTARYLRERCPGPILPLFGFPARDEFEGIEISYDHPHTVVIGDYFPHYDYELLKAAYAALSKGAELVAMHSKRSWPTEGKRVIDLGFWVAGLEYCAGKTATIIGKPGIYGYQAVLDDTGFAAQQAVMISDEEDPDLRGARALGLHTICFQGSSPLATANAGSYAELWTLLDP